MMRIKHKFVEFGGNLRDGTVFRRLRRCLLCGKVQEYNTVTNWMRVVGYRWEPTIGRCPGYNPLEGFAHGKTVDRGTTRSQSKEKQA